MLRRGGAHAAIGQGKAVQVDPMKPKLKPPGTKRLKLKCDILLSTSAFKFSLRRYTKVCSDMNKPDGQKVVPPQRAEVLRQGLTLVQFSAQHKHL